MRTTPQTGKWLLRKPPQDSTSLLFCFPYAGVGASSYRDWPPTLAGGTAVCALQPPGRENRFREPGHPDHGAFARDLVDFLTPLLERPFAFAGHCGAVPFALETILTLEDRGLPLPRRLFASSWGAPHRGLYGELNFVDLDTADLVHEVRQRYLLTGQGEPPPELAEIAARVLKEDLVVQRPYRYDAGRRLPCPVTVVSWSDDDVVPAATVPPGWEECAPVRFEHLEGKHLDFLSCPQSLKDVIAADFPA
ncbi:thioesterase II family protein [Wenjunlia tyrosinilytica]|uniref:Thioesterase n=1 Tax=Wenjunlia tyrosinilytica TaxID=1544741 RepID=A0A917ZU58_9ACTN|nr:thioesterase domain-containing protein [Wenjunlia tyrosinilytica]GGO94215.1 thioesterase [Wenjunlia tyrosinilytica]